MDRSSCYQLGYIAKAHGIKGEVRAIYDVARIDQYKKQESVLLLLEGKLTPVRILSIRILDHKEVLLLLEGFSNRDAAENLQGVPLFMPLDSLPKLKKGQFYYHEIIGFQVVDAHLGPLGKVLRVQEMPAQDLLVMDFQGNEILIPILDAFVPDLDRENQILFTSLPEGLLDIYIPKPGEEAE